MRVDFLRYTLHRRPLRRCDATAGLLVPLLWRLCRLHGSWTTRRRGLGHVAQIGVGRRWALSVFSQAIPMDSLSLLTSHFNPQIILLLQSSPLHKRVREILRDAFSKSFYTSCRNDTIDIPAVQSSIGSRSLQFSLVLIWLAAVTPCYRREVRPLIRLSSDIQNNILEYANEGQDSRTRRASYS